jgi:signal recognition particle receptor subunit beta
MPSWDSARNCYVVRIVYDGPGMAGKTTNLHQITQLVSAKRRSEMYTPAELKGRTMFFDWMEVKGPPVSKSEITFQLITVPGQIERNYRRRPLVEMADVVVFVSDCSPKQIPDTMRTFARLRASMKRRKQPVPLVVQANKQDDPEAMPPEKLRKKLRVAADVPIISSKAIDGSGVRETLATAMRIGIGTIAGVEILPEKVAFFDGDTLFDHVLTFEDRAEDKEPVDVEELYIGAEEVDVDHQAAAGHLQAQSLDALEARAKRAAKKQETDAPVQEPEQAVARRSGGPKRAEKKRG